MTISSVLNRVNNIGNGVTQIFAVSFPFRSSADLVVLSTIIATGVQTTKNLTTHYTISGTPDALGHYSSGGSVTMLIAPENTERLTIYRSPARLQELDLTESGNLPAESLEAQLDYLTMLVQRVSDLIDRSVRQPDGDSANIAVLPSSVDRALKYLYFDENGHPAVADVIDIDPSVSIVNGVWTPSIGGTATYSAQVGTYQKIGTRVTVDCNLIINVRGTGSQTTITGLPFTVGGVGGVSVVRFVTLSQNVVFVIAYAVPTSTSVLLQTLLAAGPSLGTNNVIGDGSALIFQITYTAV